MRLITSRLYRAFPELDQYSDERCERFVAVAKRGRWRRIWNGLLIAAMGLVGSMVGLGLIALFLWVTNLDDAIFGYRPSRRSLLLASPCLLFLGLGPIGGFVARDWLLRRRVRYIPETDDASMAVTASISLSSVSARTGAAQGDAPSLLRPAADFSLPAAYRQRTEALTHDSSPVLDAEGRETEYWNSSRIQTSARFQYHVYRWGAALVRSRGLASVLDVGCGPATKLATLIAPVCPCIAGIDQSSAITVARRLERPGDFRVVDLEHCQSVQAERTYDLIICADVLEHLLDPDPALALIARHCHANTLVLLSTPDRARLRGRGCMTSEKPEHVREWAAPEFLAYLRSRRWSVLRALLLPSADEPILHGQRAICCGV